MENRTVKAQRQGTGGSREYHKPEQEQRSSWMANSKFNRLLGNIEKSILGQFNGNNSGGNTSSRTNSEKGQSNSMSKQTSAKRKQMIQHHHQANNSAASTSNSSQNGHAIQTLERARQAATRGDKVTSTIKATTTTTTKSASERLGMSTLNKCQPQQQQQQPTPPNSFATLHPNQVLATHKLAIPPPHANDEARNMNHSLLFGSGASPSNSQSLVSDAASQHSQLNVSSATLRRGSHFDKQLEDSLHISRVNSSPASSAKSLPVVGPKPGSHLTKQHSKLVANKETDEDSGFSNYQPRRSFVVNQQQQQQQQPSSVPQSNSNTSTNQENKMMLTQMNHFISPQNIVTNRPMQNYVHANYPNTHQNIQASFQQGQQHIPIQQTTFNQHNQPMIFSSNQVPITTIDNNYNSQNFANVNQNSLNNLLMGQNLIQQQQQQQQHSPMPHARVTNLYDGNQLHHIQRFIDRQNLIDHGNAPPKPRRYQYYDRNMSIATGQMIQANMNVPTMFVSNLPTTLSNNGQIFANHNQQQQQATFNQHPGMITNVPSQQIFGHAFTNVPRQNPSTNGVQMMRSHQNTSNMHLGQHSNQNVNYQPAEPTRLINYPLAMSKSSLDAADLVRYRQNRQHSFGRTMQPISHNQQPMFSLGHETMNTNQRYLNTTLPVHQFLGGGGNLQRSKSVTHLLPESSPNNGNNNNSQSHHQHQANPIDQRFNVLTSISTNQLNLIGANQAPLFKGEQFDQENRSSIINSASQANDLNEPIYSNSPLRHQQLLSTTNNWTTNNPQRQKNASQLDNQLSKAKSMTALNFSHRANSQIKHLPTASHHHQHNHSNMTQETSSGGSFVKPSLDDQIKHLLIDRSDTIDAPNYANSRGLVIDENQAVGTSATHETCVKNNGIVDCLAPSHSSSASVATQTPILPPAWVKSNDINNTTTSNVIARHPPQQQQQPQQAQQAQINVSSASARLANSVSKQDIAISQTSHQFNNRSSQRRPINLNALSTGNFLVSDSDSDRFDMGNRQQRQYQIQQVANVQQQQPAVNSTAYRRQSDANNSQLIVDLTTPRVLARTQTKLVAAESGSNSGDQSTNRQSNQQAWSINQVGLPQIIASPTSLTNPPDDKISQAPTSHQPLQPVKTTLIKDVDQSSEKLAAGVRTAPYYYSDLKSEEQQRALMNIVQQKSLSPPPQLLSRSVDQNSTRLTSKSATLHSSHARTLSESLAQRRLRVNEDGGRIGAMVNGKNLSSLKESSSTSNIAENIDKLFERPLKIKLSDKTLPLPPPSARSMLALNESGQESRDFSHISLDQVVTREPKSESISSGYCSGELGSKNLSKSKSLENVGGELQDSGSSEKECSSDPVYENIHRSSKLLIAINDASDCFKPANKSRTSSKTSSPSSLSSPKSDDISSDSGADELSKSPTNIASNLDSKPVVDAKNDSNNFMPSCDDDFIEFLSDDIPSHRSQFGASQFSASDFNSSTSNSESSNSATSDSINSLLTNNNNSDSSNQLMKKKANNKPILSANGSGQPIISAKVSVGILKSSKKNYVSYDDGSRNLIMSDKAKRVNGSSGSDVRKNEEELANGIERFKNVLGNVIDVDICPINNLSTQCSPVNNQAA